MKLSPNKDCCCGGCPDALLDHFPSETFDWTSSGFPWSWDETFGTHVFYDPPPAYPTISYLISNSWSAPNQATMELVVHNLVGKNHYDDSLWFHPQGGCLVKYVDSNNWLGGLLAYRRYRSLPASDIVEVWLSLWEKRAGVTNQLSGWQLISHTVAPYATSGALITAGFRICYVEENGQTLLKTRAADPDQLGQFLKRQRVIDPMSANDVAIYADSQYGTFLLASPTTDLATLYEADDLPEAECNCN